MVFKSTSLNSGVRATVFSFPMIDWNALLRLSLLTFLLAFFGIAKINGQCTLMATDPVVNLNVGATNSATLDAAAIAGNVTVTGAGCTIFTFYDMLGNSLGTSVAINCDGTGNGPGLYVVDVNDGAGSFSNQVQLTVNTVDNTDPTFTLPNDIIVNCQDDRDDLSITGDVTDEMDNCATGIEATYADDESGLTGCNGTGTVVRTWTLDDGNGNSASMDQTITVQDVTSPMFTVPADVTIDACNDDIMDLTLTGDVTDESDNCSMGLDASFADAAPVAVPGGCANESTVVRTWTLVDDCSNATVLMQTITLKDITDPSSDQMDVTVDNDMNVCGANVTLTLDASNTSDNCDAFADLTITNDFAGGAGTADASGLYPVGTTTVSFTITDQCGQGIVHEVDVTVVDTLKPTIINCPADVTINNDPGNCDNTYAWIAPSSSDNCPGAITEEITVAPSSVIVNTGTPGPGRVDFADFPVGTSTITYAFKDVNGASDTCRFTVTVLDTIAPTVICPADQVIDFGGCNAANELVPDYRSLLSVADNCANGFTVTQSPAQNTPLSGVTGVTPADGETFMVTLTATDNNANNQSASCTIMVTLNENGSISPATPGTNLPTISNTCGSVLVCAPTAVDECGTLLAATPNPGSGATLSGTCSPPCTANPTVSQAIGLPIDDNSAIGTNYTIAVAGQGPIIDETSFSLEINHTWVGDIKATLESPSGTVIDLFDRPGSVGGTVGCSADNLNLNFSDDAPNSAADLEATCNFGGTYAINGSYQPLDPMSSFNGENPNGNWILNVSDNAAFDFGSVVGVSFDFCTLTGATINQYEFGIGSTTVTWSYDDGNGNTLTQLQLIDVMADNQGPTFTCQDITVELDDDGSVIVPAGTILGENIQFNGGNLGLGSGAGFSDYCFTAAAATSIAFDYDYISNNSNAFFDPFGYTLNGAFTALATGDAAVIVDIPSLIQNGSFSIDLAPGDVFCISQQTLDNAFGNGQATVTNLVVDNAPFNAGDWAENTVNSDGGVVATSAMATDNCGVDFSTLALAGGSAWEANCGNIGTNSLTLSLSDINGNPSTCIVNVTVEDNLIPSLTDVPNDTTVTCGNIPPAGTPTINDNCSTGLTAVLNPTSTQSGNPNTCSNYSYVVTRTWMTTDNAGNVATATQNITVVDSEAPTDPVFSDNILTNGTVNTNASSCDANVSLALTNLTDCAPFANLTISNNSAYAFSGGADATGIYPVGTHNVNFTVSDPCGNTVSFNRVFTVVDNVSPIASCKPATLGLPSNGNLTLLPGFINDGSTDNCSTSGNLTLSVSPNQFDCSHADGTTQWPVTLTVTDEALNTATCNSYVVIQDNFDPTVNCRDITITLDPSGNASITAADINDGSFDNCTPTGDLIVSAFPTTFNENNVGNNLVVLSVEDSNGNIGTCTAIVTVDIPETCFEVGTMAGPAGSVVTVPVTVSNFVNVGSFQFYLVASDPSILEIQSLTALPSLGFGSFSYNEIGDDSIRVSYSIPGVPLTPLTLADGTAIIDVAVELTGNVGDFSFLVLTDDDPNGFPIRVAHNFNGNLFNRTPCTIDGGVSINAPASLTIAGDIYNEDADPIANVEVTISDGNPTVVGTQTTAADGIYAVFPVFANEDYTISPAKNTGWTNGVTAFDLSEIQKHVVGLDTLPTVYKKLAADAFKDGIITTFDVLQLQILLASAVGGPNALVTPPGQTSWIFVPALDTPAATIPLIVPAYNQTIFMANLQTDSLDNDFIGVKIGDVTGNADPSTFTNDDDAGNRGLTSAALVTDDLTLEEGATITLPFTFNKEENWVAGQWVLDFDASALKLIDAIPAANSGFEKGDFGMQFSQQGKLSVIAAEAFNIQSKVGQELFELVFEVKTSGRQLSEVLTIDESVLSSNLYDENGFASEVKLAFNENQVLGGDNELLQNRPNPFIDETVIGFTLAETGNITLTISDIAGRVITVINEDRGAGYNEINVSRNDLPENGVYIYRLESGDFSAVKKMTLLSK